MLEGAGVVAAAVVARTHLLENVGDDEGGAVCVVGRQAAELKRRIFVLVLGRMMQPVVVIGIRILVVGGVTRHLCAAHLADIVGVVAVLHIL